MSELAEARPLERAPCSGSSLPKSSVTYESPELRHSCPGARTDPMELLPQQCRGSGGSWRQYLCSLVCVCSLPLIK